MITPTDEQFLRRAIRLAMDGRGHTEPNPSVGCVLVKEGRIIGEGRTQAFGGAHAEPTALASCTQSPQAATAYVTLEPCCHLNKKTPPCAPRLIAANVARVVYGCLDPNPDVNGNGVAMLREAGIAVDGPLLEAEARQLIAPFTLLTQHKRPYVTLKWAQTADGKVAGPGGKRIQISGRISSGLVHVLRSRSEAIVVGVNTVFTDDPRLSARDSEGESYRTGNPWPYILDTRLRVPHNASVFTEPHVSVAVICSKNAKDRVMIDDATALRNRKIGVLVADSDAAGTHLSLESVLHVIADDRQKVAHVLVEPGPTLARSFFDSGLVDRVWVIRSPKRVDDDTAPAATPVPDRYVKAGELVLGDDVLTEYLNPDSPAFFAAVPSADLVLAGGGLAD